MLFECKLRQKDGTLKELFFRNGKSEKDVLDGLELFQWPEGEWEVLEVGE